MSKTTIAPPDSQGSDETRYLEMDGTMRLFFLLFTMGATALAGAGVVAVLAMGMDGWQPIVIAAALGALIAAPASWIAAKKIRAQ